MDVFWQNTPTTTEQREKPPQLLNEDQTTIEQPLNKPHWTKIKQPLKDRKNIEQKTEQPLKTSQHL